MPRPRMAKIGAQLEQKRFQLKLAMMLWGPKPPGPAWLHFVDGPAFGAISNVVVLVNLIAALFETLMAWYGWFYVENCLLAIYSFQLGFWNYLDFIMVLEVSWTSGSCR